MVTFWPHPRLVLGNHVELLSTLERRLELLEDAGVDEVLVVEFTPELAGREPSEFCDIILRRIGAEVIVVGENFRFGRGAAGDPGLLAELGFDVRTVPVVPGVSSTAIRSLLREGDVVAAARLLGRPPSSTARSCSATSAAERSGIRRPTSPSLQMSSSLPMASMRGLRSATAPRSRSASTRTTAATSAGSSRISSTSRVISTGSASSSSCGSAYGTSGRSASEEELVGQITRDVAETRAAERPA